MITSRRSGRLAATVLSVSALFFISPQGVCAVTVTKESVEFDKIREKFHQHFPEVQILSVGTGSIAGLYEIVTPAEIVYTDSAAEHLFVGRIISTDSKLDLTAQRWDTIHAIDFNALPLDLAIKEVRGTGARRIAIFEDPHCPYCAQLERDTQELTDVTIYRFLYPLEDLHPGAEETAARIWCSKDPTAAWNEWMRTRAKPAAEVCEQFPKAKLAEVAKNVGVSGTPTTFSANGRRLFGAADKTKIEAFLAASQLASAAHTPP